MGKVTLPPTMREDFRKFVRTSVESDLSARADRVVEKAKADVPKLSHTLENSIHKEAFPGGPGRGYRIIADARAPGADHSYALPVEVGHVTRAVSKLSDPRAKAVAAGHGHFVSPQPYMLPALEAARDDT